MSDSQDLTVTLDDTSPLIRYTPTRITNDTTKGWTAYCNAVTGAWRCDEHSAHSTGFDGATFALSFYGTGVTLYGNLTLGMRVTIAVDGQSVIVQNGGDSQTLAVVKGLSAAQHTVLLTAGQGASQSLLTFDRAVVALGSAKSVNKTYVGGNSSAIVWGPPPNPPWSSPQTYEGTITPAGIDNTHFNASITAGATFYHKFQGSAFFWYGSCYTDTYAYTVTLDGGVNSQPQQFNASVPYGQVIEGCLMYYAAGLAGGGTSHEFLATNAENHWMTMGWLEVWDYQLVAGSSGSSPNAATTLSVLSSGTFALLMVLYSLLLRLL